MADLSVKSRTDEPVAPRRVKASAQDDRVFQRTTLTGQYAVDLHPYLQDVWNARRAIAWAVFLMFVAALTGATLFLPKTYRAMAIVRPTNRDNTTTRLTGALGGGGLSPLATILGTGTNQSEAEEYMTILQSFAFNISLIERHHLRAAFYKPSSHVVLALIEDKDPRWRGYNRLSHSFSCEYSSRTGNMILYFKGKTPAEAERLLGYYIDDLRDKLHKRSVQSATIAINSITKQALDTSDPLLKAQLYELIARQIQQLRLAQVEADFAFTVLEPPIARDAPYSPNPLLDAAVVSILTLLVSAFIVIGRSLMFPGLQSRASIANVIEPAEIVTRDG